MICRFAYVDYEFINGNIKSIKNTNKDLHDIADNTPREDEINNYLFTKKI